MQMTRTTKSNKVITLEKETIEIDKETGEQTTVKQEFTKIVERDHFIQAYIDGMRGILKIESKTDIRVLVALWLRAEYNTNRVVLIKQVKEEIAEELGYKNYRVIDNSISRLKKLDILHKKGTSYYYIDPNLFFYGSSKARTEMVEIVYKIKVANSK